MKASKARKAILTFVFCCNTLKHITQPEGKSTGLEKAREKGEKAERRKIGKLKALSKFY